MILFPSVTPVLTRIDSFYRNSIQATFETAAAALRLGSKYGFEDMKHEALRRISTCYTTDLGNLHTHVDDCDDPCKCPISWEVGDCIGVLHLARQLGLGLLVPAALYRCANDVPIERTFQTSTGQAQLPMLGFRELEDCVRSRDDLMLESVRLYGMFSNLQPSPGCLQVAKKGTLWGKKDVGCLQVLKTMIASAEGRNFCGPLTLFRAETYITSHTEPIPSGSFCAPCGEHFKSLHAQQREEIWSRFCEKYGNSYHSVSLQYLLPPPLSQFTDYCAFTRSQSEADSTQNSEATAVNPRIPHPLSGTDKAQRLHVDQFEYSSSSALSYFAYLTRFVRGLTALASPLFDLLLSVFFKPFLQRKAYMGVIRM